MNHDLPKLNQIQLLIENQALLAVGIFLYENDTKIDINQLINDFGNSAEALPSVDLLCELGLASISHSGKKGRPRVSLTILGKETIKNILQAAERRRSEMSNAIFNVPVALKGGELRILAVENHEEMSLEDTQTQTKDLSVFEEIYDDAIDQGVALDSIRSNLSSLNNDITPESSTIEISSFQTEIEPNAKGGHIWQK